MNAADIKEKRVAEAIEDGLQILTCKICGYQSYLSLISHITRKHKLNMLTYREQFPYEIVQQATKRTRKKNSENIVRYFANDERKKEFLKRRSFPSEIKHWLNKGFSLEDAKLKVSEFQKKQSLKGNNEKTRLLRSLKNKGDVNPMSIKSIAKRYNVSLEKAHELTPCFGRVADKHPMFGKTHSLEAIRKIASAHHLTNPDYRSKPERELENACASFAQIEHNVQIQRWNVDIKFINQPVIVELFGDFWHANPAKYDEDFHHYLLKKTAKEIWKRDSRKIQELEALGFKVIIIWESDWKLRKDESLQRIKNALN